MVAAQLKPKPRQRPGKQRSRPFTVRDMRIRDLRRLAQHRSAFAVETPLGIALLEALAMHLIQLPGDPHKRIARFLDENARWYGIERFDDLLERIKEGPRYWKASELGWHLRLTERERAHLHICSIEAAGVSPEQRKAINLERRRQKRAETHAAKGGKTRDQWLADHSEKPWIEAGISRRTWKRRQCAQVADD